MHCWTQNSDVLLRPHIVDSTLDAVFVAGGLERVFAQTVPQRQHRHAQDIVCAGAGTLFVCGQCPCRTGERQFAAMTVNGQERAEFCCCIETFIQDVDAGEELLGSLDFFAQFATGSRS